MPFPSGHDHPPRRNARSFDLDASATKAAAWVWHLHESKPGVTTEGRFLSSQSRRRSSSSSYDVRRSSRFRQEAAESSSSSSTRTKAGAMNFERPAWDCGSNLYDTFELVAFGNRLDRCLMKAVPLTPPPPLQAHVNIPHEHHRVSPLQAHVNIPCDYHTRSPSQEPSGVLRTRSLPKSMKAYKQSSKNKNASTAPLDGNRASLAKSRELSFSVFNQDQVPKRWPSVEKFVKALKKVVVLHKQLSTNVGCKHSIKVLEPGQSPLQKPLSSGFSPSHGCVGDDLSSSVQGRISKARRKSADDELLSGRRRDSIAEGDRKPQSLSQNYHKHLHHHHHHHHHHYLHHTLASESARLSPETISQICTEESWVA